MDSRTLPKHDGKNALEGFDQAILILKNEVKSEPIDDPLGEYLDEFTTNRNEHIHCDATTKILKDQENSDVITESIVHSDLQAVQSDEKKSGFDNETLKSGLQDIIVSDGYDNIDIILHEIRHEVVSTVDKPKVVENDCNYVCHECNEDFCNSKTLKNHVTTHKKRMFKKLTAPKGEILKRSSSRIISAENINDGVVPPGGATNHHIDQLENGIAVDCTSNDQSYLIKLTENSVFTKINNIDSDIQNDDELFKIVHKKKTVRKTKKSKERSTKKSKPLMDSSELLTQISDERINSKQVEVDLKRTSIIDEWLQWGPCEICQKSFRSSAALSRHVKTHSNAPRIQCDTCHRKFGTMWHLKRHYTSHTGRKIHQCGLCPKSFNTVKELQKHHIISHTNQRNLKDAAAEVIEKPFLCTACGARFKFPDTLKYHAEKSCNLELFECDVCDYKHKSRSILNRHRITHTGEKRFTCKLCHFKFSQRYHLERHVKRQHVDKTSDECSVCQRAFCRERQLTEHYATVHEILKPYHCDRCDAKFGKKIDLKNHLFTHDDAQGAFECDICYKKIKTPSLLATHKRKHSRDQIYTCGNCSKKFLNLDNIRKHIEVTHFKPQKDFNLVGM